MIEPLGERCKMGYNHFPDEKGTESLMPILWAIYPYLVTITSPMKRGLKDAPHSLPLQGRLWLQSLPR